MRDFNITRIETHLLEDLGMSLQDLIVAEYKRRGITCKIKDVFVGRETTYWGSVYAKKATLSTGVEFIPCTNEVGKTTNVFYTKIISDI